MAHGVTGDGWVEMLPVYQVFAHGVSPVHIAPLTAIGIVLEVEVVLAVLIDHAVGVVHPAVEGSEVVRGTVVVGIGGIEGVAQLHQVEGEGVLGEAEYLDGSGLAMSQREGHIVVGAVLSQAHVHPSVVLGAGIEQHLRFILLFLDRQQDVLGGVVYTDDGCVALVFDVHLLGGGAGGNCSHQHEACRLHYVACSHCVVV